jgi:hypothetical protein
MHVWLADVWLTVGDVAAVLTIFAFALSLWYALRRLAVLQRLLRFRVRGQIDIVMTTLKEPVPGAGAAPHDKWATSLGNVVAASQLAQAVGSVPRPRPINLYLSRDHPTPREDLVLLGGVNENALSHEFMRSLALNVPDVNFICDDHDEDANLLRLGYTGQAPLLEEVYPWESEAHEKEPAYDYGVIVLWVNPFAPEKRRAVLCAGFTAPGTAATASLLLNTIARGYYQQMRPTLLSYVPGRRKGHAQLPPRLFVGRWPHFILAFRISLEGDPHIDGSPAILPLPTPRFPLLVPPREV